MSNLCFSGGSSDGFFGVEGDVRGDVGATETCRVEGDLETVDSENSTGASSIFEAADEDRWKSFSFSSVADALSFYQKHAHRRGFSVRIDSQAKRNNANSDVKYVKYLYYYCSKQGFKTNSLNDPNYGKDIEKSLQPAMQKQRVFKEERTGCLARIRFKCVGDSTYIITLWYDGHNHPLQPPELSHHIRSNRSITNLYGQLIEANKQAGLSNKSSYDLICQAAGGIPSAGFLKIDMKNFLRGKRSRDLSACDLSILLQFLSFEAKTKPSFFYDIQLDEDSLITNIFWSDGLMQHDYSCFGDVVSLDTTFRTNKEYFPLAAFLGFTHNRQSCIFGAALLHDQTSETFEWLLHVFLKCMGGKRPVSLFTDQDAAMRKAIDIVLPDCFHGLCSWHICENATRRLGSLDSKAFFTHFNFLISQVDNESDFEFNWKLMIDQCFNGEEHSWLQFIYPFRHQWSSAWVKSHFTAGLKSTQVSESFNSFLRDYVSVNYSLPQFFHNFNLILDHMREKLNKSVYESIHYLPLIRFNHSAIIKQASKVYTPPIFNLFQDQYSLIPEYFVDLDDSSCVSLKKICCVFKNDPSDPSVKLDLRLVVIDLTSLEWTCSCRMFANWGILCCHILKAVDILGSFVCNSNLRSIPEKYILKRWTRSARGEIGAWSLPQNDHSNSSTFALRHQAYCSSMIRISSRICVDDDVYCFFMQEVNAVLKRVEERLNSTSNVAAPVSIGSMSTGGNTDFEVESRLQSAKGIKKRTNANKSKKRLRLERKLDNQRLKANRSKAINDQSIPQINDAIAEDL